MKIEEIHSFDAYEDFIRHISSDSSFTDPHFEYAENNLYNSLNKPGRKAYIVTDEASIMGLFIWLIIEDEKYIELMIGLSKHKAAYEHMLSYIENMYPGYQMDFVINPSNHIFRSVLEKRYASFEKEQIRMICDNSSICAKATKHSDFHNAPGRVSLLAPEYEDQYLMIHCDDVYWTARRLLDAQDKFRIFVALDGDKVIGYLDVTYGNSENEPYALWVDSKYSGMGYEQTLLLAALKMSEPEKMMVLVDIDAYDEIKIYESVGFSVVDWQNSLYATYTL